MVPLQLIILFTSLFSLSSTASYQDNRNASLNDIVDEIVKNIGKSGKEIGLEPLKIPDIHQQKDKNGGIEAFNLTDGILTNVISVKRFGDAEVSYKSGILNVKVGFQFSELESNFNFNVKAWGLNPDGHLTAIIPDLTVTMDGSIDPFNLNATLNKILIPSVGDLKVTINTTKPIYGMIMESLIDSITLFLQDEIVYVLGKIITNKLNEMILTYEELLAINQ